VIKVESYLKNKLAWCSGPNIACKVKIDFIL